MFPTSLPPEPAPTAIPTSQFFHGSEVVTGGLGVYSVRVPDTWWAMSTPGSDYVVLADYDMSRLEPPSEGALTVRMTVEVLPESQDIRGRLTHEIELLRTNPDGLLDPTQIASLMVEEVVAMHFFGLDGYGYRATKPDVLSFVAEIDEERFLLVRMINTWTGDAPSLKVLDTLIVTLHSSVFP